MCWLPPTVLGFVLRFWSLGFGLPNHFRPDEDMVVLPSLGMVGGNLDPHDYTYPTLYKYILVLVYRVCMMLGVGAQGYESAWQYAAYGFFVDGSFFFIVARGVSAVFGVLTILALYRVGELAYGRWVGGVCAWFLSVSVLHVRDSHFGVTDISSVALLMFGLVYCVHIAQRGALKDYVWAGVFVGLAASAKYGAVLGLVPLGVAHLCRRPEGVPLLSQWIWQRKVWFAGVVCVLAFVVTSPYLLLKLDDFARYFGAQMRHVYEHGHGVDLGPGWMYHPTVTLRYGLGLLGVVCGLGGFAWVCYRRQAEDWVVLSLCIAFFVVTGRGRAVFFRYALPLVPLCCLLAGVFIHWIRGLSMVPKRAMLGVVLVVLCVLEPVWASVRLNMLLGKKDTRAQAREWIEEHLMEGLLIANVGGVYGDVTLRNRRGVPWWLWRYMRGFSDVDPIALANFLSQFEDDLPAHFSYHFFPGVDRLDEHTRGFPELLDNPEMSIVITHEHPLHYSTVSPEFLNVLKQKATLRAEFRPGADEDLNRAVFDLQDAFYYPMGAFGALDRGGPMIRIWDIKERPLSVFPNAKDQQKLLRDAFYWMGLSMEKTREYQIAQTLFQSALRLDADFDAAQLELHKLQEMIKR